MKKNHFSLLKNVKNTECHLTCYKHLWNRRVAFSCRHSYFFCTVISTSMFTLWEAPTFPIVQFPSFFPPYIRSGTQIVCCSIGSSICCREWLWHGPWQLPWQRNKQSGDILKTAPPCIHPHSPSLHLHPMSLLWVLKTFKSTVLLSIVSKTTCSFWWSLVHCITKMHKIRTLSKL